jgi:hypothetical protein
MGGGAALLAGLVNGAPQGFRQSMRIGLLGKALSDAVVVQ